jgi:hypothetical protein
MHKILHNFSSKIWGTRRKLGRPGRGLKDDIKMEMKEQEITVEWVAVLLRIREIGGSNLTQIWVIRMFSSVFLDKCWSTSK